MGRMSAAPHLRAPVGALAPPPAAWQEAARAFLQESQAALWGTAGHRALAWLEGRNLDEERIRLAGLGYHPHDSRQPRPRWGLGAGRPVWLPRGIVIPWEIGGALWRINIRRPAGEPGTYSPAGFTNSLYRAGVLAGDKPAILVKGELDALLLEQVVGDLVAPVATGSLAGARCPRWIALLALCPLVLVSFDAGPAGDAAAAWWLQILPNALRCRPLWAGASAMAQAGVDLRAWVQGSL
jgi:DNA primase